MNIRERRIMQEIVRAVGEAEDLLAAILFGSAARGEKSSISDLDLCLVLMPKVYSALDLSKKKLEYASHFRAHVSIFQQLPLYIRKRVLQEGEILFCRDEDALYEVAFQSIRELADFAPTYFEYLKAVAHAG